MEEAALAISICAFVLSAAGFGWTIWEWHRSGARLKVTVTSFVTFGPLQPNHWMIAFDIANAGRTATTATSVGFLQPNKKGVMVLPAPGVGPNPLPKRLEPGESFMYPMEISTLIEGCAENSIDFKDLVPYVTTGHGKFEGKWQKVGIDVVQNRMPSTGGE